MLLSPELLQALILAGLKYGPELVTDIKNLFTKKDATIEDVEKVFLNLRNYASFGIPDMAPTKSLETTAT